MALRELSLFTGGGGGVLASHLLGWEIVGMAEFDAPLRRPIEARMNDGVLERVDFDWDVMDLSKKPEKYRGKIDLLTGGFPCQPFSMAGNRYGENDPRNMWPATRDILTKCEIPHGFFENVAGLITSQVEGKPSYWGQILSDIVRSGYACTWDCIRAGDVGAPHSRDRIWLVVRRLPDGLDPNAGSPPFSRVGRLNGNEYVRIEEKRIFEPDTDPNDLEEPGSWPKAGFALGDSVYRLDRSRGRTDPGMSILAMFKSNGLIGDRPGILTTNPIPQIIPPAPGERLPTIVKGDGVRRRMSDNWMGGDLVSTITRLTERPRMTADGKREWKDDHGHRYLEGDAQPRRGGLLDPAWVEWLMGWPIGWTDPATPFPPEVLETWRTAVAGLTWWSDERDLKRLLPADVRAETVEARIHVLGNGQVPICAARAATLLDIVLTNILANAENGWKIGVCNELTNTENPPPKPVRPVTYEIPIIFREAVDTAEPTPLDLGPLTEILD